MRTVKILTLDEQPTLQVPRNWLVEQIDQKVKEQFGTQSNGALHNWEGGQ